MGVPVVEFGEQYANPNGKSEYKMKEKRLSFTGDSFKVETWDGLTAFQFEGNILTFRGTKVGIIDAADEKIAVIKKHFFSLRGSYMISDADDNTTLFTVVPSFAFGLGILGFWPGGDMKVYRGEERNEGSLVYRAKKVSGICNKVYGVFKVSNDGQHQIGTISQKKGLLSAMFFGNDQYVIEVDQYVDAALVCILAMIIDDVKEGDSRR